MAESSTVLTTTRAWIERRQKVRPRRSASGTLRLPAQSATGHLRPPHCWPEVPAL